MRRSLIRRVPLVAALSVALLAGYLVSARFGDGLVRREAERQLSTLLAGAVHVGSARLRLGRGLFLEAEHVAAYPGVDSAHEPGLATSHAVARIDPLALLMGHFRLNELELDDLRVRFARDAQGRFDLPPLEWLRSREESASEEAGRESAIAFPRALGSITRVLLEAPILARRVAIHGGYVRFVDATTPTPEGGPRELAVLDLEASLEHRWFSGRAELELSAELAPAAGTTVSLHAMGRKRPGRALQLVLEAEHLPLPVFEAYLPWPPSKSPIRGLISGQLVCTSERRDQTTLRLNGELEHLSGKVELAEASFPLAEALVRIDASLEIHPGRMRLRDVRLDGSGIRASLGGSVERPLGANAIAQLQANIDGIELDQVRTLVRSLPGRDGRTLERLLRRVESARAARVGGRGRATLASWKRVVQREVERLPDGFELYGDLAGLEIGTQPTPWISELGGRVEWRGDRLSLHHATGLFEGSPMPPLDFSIDGLSHLFEGSETEQKLTSSAAALPGFGPLLNLFTETSGESSKGESAPAPALIELNLEKLDHPALRWPLRDTRVRIEPRAGVTDFEVVRGHWAGAPIRGTATWVHDPAGAGLEIAVQVLPRETGKHEDPKNESSPAPLPVAREAPTTTAIPGAESTEWVSGDFALDHLGLGSLPVRNARGRFEISNANLSFSELAADLDPRGTLEAHAALDLSHPGSVPVQLNFSLVDGDLAALTAALGLPERFASGAVELNGAFGGPLTPGRPPLATLRGEVGMKARKGRIERERPLVVAGAEAFDDEDPTGSNQVLPFDSASAEFSFEDGRISTQDFHLEGPVRLYGSGHLDIVGEPRKCDAVFGVFLFRGANQILENLPLVRIFLPGSSRGLVGAYFRVQGDPRQPTVSALPGRSLAEDLPDALTAPFRLLGALLGAPEGNEGGEDQPRPPP